MIHSFVAVLRDLWEFVIGKEEKENRETYLQLPPVSPEPTQPTLSLGEETTSVPAGLTNVFVNAVSVWVCSETAAYLVTPQAGFDHIVGYFLYGAHLVVVRRADGFVGVNHNETIVWVREADVTDERQAVVPEFKTGVLYDEAHQETVKLRQMIQDEQQGGLCGVSLQSSEYVLYRLREAGVTVAWPSLRPRVPGTWQRILRGVRGVSISVEPRTQAVLERPAESGELGFVAYVSAVHPDNSIVIEGVGMFTAGEYTVETFSHEEWREWRPVFISFS